MEARINELEQGAPKQQLVDIICQQGKELTELQAVIDRLADRTTLSELDTLP